MLLKDKYNCDKYVSIFVRHSCIWMCLYLEIATKEEVREMGFNAVATVCLSFIVYQNKANCVLKMDGVKIYLCVKYFPYTT